MIQSAQAAQVYPSHHLVPEAPFLPYFLLVQDHQVTQAVQGIQDLLWSLAVLKILEVHLCPVIQENQVCH